MCSLRHRLIAARHGKLLCSEILDREPDEHKIDPNIYARWTSRALWEELEAALLKGRARLSSWNWRLVQRDSHRGASLQSLSTHEYTQLTTRESSSITIFHERGRINDYLPVVLQKMIQRGHQRSPTSSLLTFNTFLPCCSQPLLSTNRR